EQDNFRAAWDWAVALGEFNLIEQTLRTLWMYYDTRGWYQEGLDALGRAVDALEMAHGHLPSGRPEQVALAHILSTRAWLAYRLADYQQAQGMLERSLAILRPLNEMGVMVEALPRLGMLMEAIGNFAGALELYSEGAELAAAVGDRYYAALSLTLLNALHAVTPDMVNPEDAYARLQAAVDDCRRLGDPRLTGFGLRLLSQSAYTLRRYAEARSALEESVELNGSIGFGWGLGAAYRGLGRIAQAQGQHQQAVVMFRKALDTFTELGGSWWVARLLAEMSYSFFALGNDAEAESVWRESLRIATEIHGTPVALDALAGLASLQAKQGDLLPQALELLLIVLNHPACLQDTRDRVNPLRAEVEARLSRQQVEAAQSQARVKPFDQMVEQILREGS
ncbi:MAG TPA: tetratricopeptide repeat protein, partial [Anaerolineales bacterium]